MNKAIWMYWHQGWDQAPELVQICRDSWQRLNPDYTVHALDYHSLSQHIQLPPEIHPDRKDMTLQKMAAISRLHLLVKHGGVWADATTACVRPLDDWIHDCAAEGFFAFRNKSPDRVMCNWFLAAEAGNPLLSKLTDEFTSYYCDNHFTNQETRRGRHFLKRFNHKAKTVETTLFWHTWFARKILRVYPYFIFHYTFNKIIHTDPECRSIWDAVKPIHCAFSMMLQNWANEHNGAQAATSLIRSGACPVFKLNWRDDFSKPYWQSILKQIQDIQ